jgi:methoxymalonate biosynthesis acyl carrier protein
VTTEARLTALFRTHLHLEVPSLDTDLLETGLLDSLLIVELLLHIERELGRTLPMEELELEDFRTLTTIARCIERNGPPTRLRV